MGVYVYGVVASGTPLSREDRGLGAVWGVTEDELTAVCSTVADEPVGRRAELRAHADVLAGIVADHAVVPFTFGTVLPDEEAVREVVLTRRAARLRAELERLADVVQFNVRFVPDEDRLIADVMASSPELRSLDESVRALPAGQPHAKRVRLGEAVAQHYRSWVERLVAAAVDVLAGSAAEVRIEPTETADPSTRAAFLVARDEVSSFLEEAGHLAENMRGRLTCRVTGPLAPFSFVSAPADDDALAGAG